MNQQRSPRPRRRAIPLAAALVLLAACGDDESAEIPSTEPPTTEVPTTTEPAAPEHVVQTGTDDIVVSFAVGGGLVTELAAFQDTPSIVVTGDGRVIVRSAGSDDGPALLPELTVRTISPDGIQALIAAADDAGLLRDVEYESSQTIADAGTTTVVVAADGETWTHSVYALGFYEPIDRVSPDAAADQMALESFVDQLVDLESLVGADQLGPAEPYVPDTYLIAAVPIEDPSDLGGGVEFAFADWPADASVRLADAPTCTPVDAAAVAGLLESAGLFTVFVEDEVRYEVLVKHGVPGATC